MSRPLTLSQARAYADFLLRGQEPWKDQIKAVAIMNSGTRYGCAVSNAEVMRAKDLGWIIIEVRKSI